MRSNIESDLASDTAVRRSGSEKIKLPSDASSDEIDRGGVSGVITQEVLNEMSIKLGKVEKELEKLKKDSKSEYQRLQEQTEKSRIGLTNSLAVFVALFTFISMSFDFFSREDVSVGIAVAVILILGAFLVLFVLLVYLLTNYSPWPKDVGFWDLITREWLAFVLLMAAIVLLCIGIIRLPSSDELNLGKEKLKESDTLNLEVNIDEVYSTESAIPSSN